MGLVGIMGGSCVCDPKILSKVHDYYMDSF